MKMRFMLKNAVEIYAPCDNELRFHFSSLCAFKNNLFVSDFLFLLSNATFHVVVDREVIEKYDSALTTFSLASNP